MGFHVLTTDLGELVPSTLNLLQYSISDMDISL